MRSIRCIINLSFFLPLVFSVYVSLSRVAVVAVVCVFCLDLFVQNWLTQCSPKCVKTKSRFGRDAGIWPWPLHSSLAVSEVLSLSLRCQQSPYRFLRFHSPRKLLWCCGKERGLLEWVAVKTVLRKLLEEAFWTLELCSLVALAFVQLLFLFSSCCLLASGHLLPLLFWSFGSF